MNMNLQSNFRTIAAASVVAFVFALGSVGAMAQFEGGPHGGGFDVGQRDRFGHPISVAPAGRRSDQPCHLG